MLKAKLRWHALIGLAFASASGAALARPTCPALPAPVRVVEGQSYYDRGDPTRSTPVAEKQARDRAKRVEVNTYLSGLARLSDQVSLGDAPDARRCAAAALRQWADADALMRVAPGDNMPRFVQQWALSTLSLVAIKLRSTDDMPLDPVVNRWLGRLARQVDAFHASRADTKRNNHYYWATLALGAAAEATGDRDLGRKAMAMYHVALDDIDARGYLPRELGRGARAAKYHAFAVQPLAVFDALGRATGRIRISDPRLTRLIDLIADPDNATRRIEAATGKKQEPIGFQAWTAAVRGRACDAHFIQRLGGRMSALSNALARLHGDRAPCGSGSRAGVDADRPGA